MKHYYVIQSVVSSSGENREWDDWFEAPKFDFDPSDVTETTLAHKLVFAYLDYLVYQDKIAWADQPEEYFYTFRVVARAVADTEVSSADL